jgi:Xaa-Pro aminopeptidase
MTRLVGSEMCIRDRFTVEPGIYIPAEGFGIRIEDDMVIQEKGAAFNLMRNIPIEVEEIESIMNS